MKTKLLHRLRVEASRKFCVTVDSLKNGKTIIQVHYLDKIFGLRHRIMCEVDEEAPSLEKAFKLCDEWQRNYILRRLNIIRKIKNSEKYGK